MSERYYHSEQFLERSQKVVPLGSQTFSKSRTQYPLGVSPFYIKRALGARTWDLDDNEYIDFINGLGAIQLGHCDPDVSEAAKTQIDCGTIFSLPHPIETEVAEMIAARMPCAEKVRFGKNGSDATSGCVRVARAHTGRDRIANCGYHGWQDWHIGSTARAQGVPQAVRDLTHSFVYNDIDSLHALFKTHPGEFAGVILEPMSVVEPKPGFLQSVAELTRKNGAVLIFDEVVTGFRQSEGGAQKRFGVTPDLAAIGKGMANGYPLAAVVGRAEIMRQMEEVFFSFTYGGDALSLAAGRAALTKMSKVDIWSYYERIGELLRAGFLERARRHGVSEWLGLIGHPSLTAITFKDVAPYSQWEIKTLFFQEVFARGILTIGTHNLSHSIGEAEIARLMAVYDEVFPILEDTIRTKSLEKRLKAKPLSPLFQLRKDR